MRVQLHSARRAQVSAIALMAALASGPALAQAKKPTPKPADDIEVGEVVVTGTSIRGVAGAGSERVAVTHDEIIKSGLATSTDVARSLPQVMSLGADESRRGGAQDAAANRTATSGINLRGLSTEATLLLVNGRRLAPNGTIKALADPSVIPAIALERLEVVPDGASAIYGADAVAGVVNMITRKPFDGAETVLRYSWGDDIDGKQFSQLLGKTWSGGGVMVAYEYNQRSNLAAASRWYLSNDLRSRGGTDQRSTLSAPGNIVSGTTRYPLPDTNGRGLTAAQLQPGTANRFDAGLYGDVLPEQERNTVFMTANHKLTDRFELYYEGYYSRRKFYEAVTPASSTLSVPRTNPFYVNPVSPTATTVSVEYRFLDANGKASWSGFDNSQHQSAGFRFDLGHEWQIDAYGSNNINRGRARTEDLLNLQFLPLALADTNPATAFNPFGNGNPANNNPETLRKIQGVRDSYTTNIGNDLVAKADGPLFDMPGGKVRLAVGAEYHEATLKYLIMSSIKNANNDLLKDRERFRERNNSALFAEAYVPLVGADNAMPFVEQLDVQLAVRHEEYSDFGNTTNPKVGVTWRPGGDVVIRGSWGTSFRAPSLIDSSDAVFNIFIQNFSDPTAPGGQRRGIFMNGGDANLKPEKADTWSIGGDWQPQAIPGFDASVTYYSIKYTDVIDVVAANTAIANPAIYGFLIQRNPTTATVDALLNSPNLESVREPAANLSIIVDGRRHNLGRINQSGVDISVSYRRATDFGDWNTGLNVTEILKQERSVAPGLPFADVLNLINFPVRTRLRGTLGWRMGPVSANAFWNHVGSYINNTPTPNVKVKAYDTFDGSVAYQFSDEGSWATKGLRLSLNGQNLFDKDPPVVINGTNGWDSQNASPLGRYLSVELRKVW